MFQLLKNMFQPVAFVPSAYTHTRATLKKISRKTLGS